MFYDVTDMNQKIYNKFSQLKTVTFGDGKKYKVSLSERCVFFTRHNTTKMLTNRNDLCLRWIVENDQLFYYRKRLLDPCCYRYETIKIAAITT